MWQSNCRITCTPQASGGERRPGGTPGEPSTAACQTELPTWGPRVRAFLWEPAAAVRARGQPDDHVEGSVIKHEPWNKVRQSTAEGSIRTAAGTSFTASRTETLGPGSNLPAHAGPPRGVRRAPRRGIRPSDAPQEVLGRLAPRPPGGITDLSDAARGTAGGVHPLGRQPADVQIPRHHSIIHSSAEPGCSPARARQAIDPRGA
jgi:hypothetical protein